MRPVRVSAAVAVFLLALVSLLWRAPSLESFLLNSDHGHQLAMGREAALGRRPFVDLFFVYGPLRAFLSAAAIRVHDSLVSETVVCALGYAAALTILFRILAASTPFWLSLAGTGVQCLLLARFYKWYYWFFPLVAVALIVQSVNLPERRGRWALLAAGLAAGVGGLFRFDLALACVATYVLFLGGLLLAEARRPEPRNIMLFVGGFLTPFTVWLAYLSTVAGVRGPAQYLDATLTGTVGAAVYLALPFPPLSWAKWVAGEEGGALAFRAIPLLLGVAVGYAVFVLTREPADGRARALLGCSLGGLTIFPQALHRSDAQHVLQILPLVIATLATLLALAASRRRRDLPIVRPCVAAAVVLCAASLWGPRSAGGADLGSWRRSGIANMRRLELGWRAAESSVVTRLIREVTIRSTEQESILILPVSVLQIYYYANRRIAGIATEYAAGVLDQPRWRARNVSWIRANPPALVIARPGFVPAGIDADVRLRQPELLSILMTDYEACYEDSGWMVLCRKRTPPSTSEAR